MLSIISTLLPMALRIVGYFIDKSAAKKETKEAFLRMVEGLQEQNLVSVNLYKEDINQMNDLDNQFKEESKQV